MQYLRRRRPKGFLELLKQYSTEECLIFFSRLAYMHFKDIVVNQENKVVKNFLVEIEYGQGRSKISVPYSAWDIPAMAYLALRNTRNYRKDLRNPEDQIHLLGAYRNYDNEHSAAEQLEEKPEDIFYILAGMTHEQFNYENMLWIMNRFNRNYHILFGSDNISRGKLENLEQVMQNSFGLSIEEVVITLYMLVILCFMGPKPLTVYEELLFENSQNKELYRQRIENLLEYYSVSKEIIESDEGKLKLGKQIFYSKPFACVNQKYISISCYLVLMLYADGVYWLIRDYCNGGFLNGEKVDFPREFGELFEDYFKELAEYYLLDVVWGVIPRSKKQNAQSADVFIETEKAMILIELKSALIPLQGKQQVPDAKKVKKYCTEHLVKAHNQLVASERRYLGSKKVLKIVLSYENFLNSNIFMKAVLEAFQNDSRCYLMGIDEFEYLLQIYQADKEVFDEVIDYYINREEDVVQTKDVYSFAKEKDLKVKSFFSGERDYWTFYKKKCREILNYDTLIKDMTSHETKL